MKFLSSYYKKQQEGAPGAVSILVQHVKCRKTRVCFACICADEAGRRGEYGAVRLLEWFYAKGIRLCAGGGERAFQRAEEGLLSSLEEVLEELGGIGKGRNREALPLQTAGILCAGCRFILFSLGRQRIYAINTRFMRANIKCLTRGTGQLYVKRGALQAGIGILLGTENFFESAGEETLLEVLTQKELRTQIQAEKRLKELGEAKVPAQCGPDRTAADIVKAAGAVLVCAR